MTEYFSKYSNNKRQRIAQRKIDICMYHTNSLYNHVILEVILN